MLKIKLTLEIGSLARPSGKTVKYFMKNPTTACFPEQKEVPTISFYYYLYNSLLKIRCS